MIGPGLLSPALCAKVYAWPSVVAVLSVILQVTGPSSCLQIIKNYMGDRLNLGLAAENAKTLGHNVEMVIVGDDIDITNAVQPRGLAGTCNAASAVAGDIRTLYLSRVTCKVPGSEKQTRIDGDEAGLGIHGLDWAILSKNSWPTIWQNW